MTDDELLNVIHIVPSLSTDTEITSGMRLIEIARQLYTSKSAASEVLAQCYMHGPVNTGDLISKVGRTELVNLGLITVGVVKGEQGFYFCNYRGADVHHLLEAMSAEAKNKAF